jgi:hypothetical protein
MTFATTRKTWTEIAIGLHYDSDESDPQSCTKQINKMHDIVTDH